MKKLLILLMIAGALAFGALNYHVILLDRGIRFMKKSDLTFDDTFVDARGRNRYKLYLQPALVKAGIKELFEESGLTIGKE